MILALDLGTKTGVAYGAPGARPRLETWVMPAGGGRDVGAFAMAFEERVDSMLAHQGVSLVIFEAPYINPYPDQMRRAYGMAWAVERLAHTHAIECAEVITGTLKKTFAGNGRAKKSDMILAAKRRGFEPANDHEADAAACWLYAVSMRWPEQAHRFDPIFVRAQAGGT